METVYLSPEGTRINPNKSYRGISNWPPRAVLDSAVQQFEGITSKLVSVPSYDPLTQSPPVQGSDGDYAQPADLPLETAKSNKVAYLNRVKAEKQLEGFEYDGMIFDCDEVAVARIHATWSFASADSSYTQPFVLKDNTTVTLTNAQCLGLGYACGQFVSGLTFTARSLKDAVLDASTVAEVRAVSWPE